MSNIKTIAKRELGGYFSSPVAYVFLVIFLLLAGFFTFMVGKFFQGQANLDAFFMWHPWLYVFLVSCVGMRLWAEERRVGTIELLLTKPVTTWQAILGKFFASWIFLGVALALTFPVILTVNYLGSPDNGVIFTAYMGSLLMAGTYLAIASMTSAMTRNQVISFIVSVVICLFLVLCGYPPVTNLLTRLDKPWLVDLVSSLSVMTHFQSFTVGMLDSRDIIFFLLLIGFALFTNGVIIRAHQTATDKLMKGKTFERVFYSTGGVAAMFAIMVAFYIVSSAAKVRVDVTADKVHTLSPGTKRILAKLDSRITLRFYCTQSDSSMPPTLKNYARHVEELLNEYQQEAAKGRGRLNIEKFDPKPDSEAENSARLNGIEGRATGPFDSDKIYLGLAVNMLDEKFALPWLSPGRERLLEYDISRAIARVMDRSRPVVGIMSGLPVFGVEADPLQRPDEVRPEDWAFITELKKDFTVMPVPLSATNIDESVKVLVVAHPVGITDAAQYAIDQFVLRGGKVVAFLDPHAYFDQKHDRSQNFAVAGDNAGSSSLDKLLKSWGFEMDTNLVAADLSFASRNMQTGDSMPTLLLVTRAGIDEEDTITSQIDNLVFPFAGAINGKPAAGLKENILVKCSGNSELVDTMIATSAAEQILRNFKASNVEYPLVVHLSGNFKTAFPDGPPIAGAKQLKESGGRGEVILVSDSDMLNDKVCVRPENTTGRPVMRAVNGNLGFVQSAVEQLSGDDDLINARNRANMARPFTRVRDMEVKASRQWQEKLLALESNKKKMQDKIRALPMQNTGADGQSQHVILSSAQEAELKKSQDALAKISKELNQVRKNLQRDTDALEFHTKVVNIAAMPLIVAMSGLCLGVVKTRRRGPR